MPSLFRRACALAALISFTGLLNCCGDPRANSAARVYDLGNRVEAGHLTYTVFETQWLTQIGAADTARVPKSRFLLVRLTAVNSGSDELIVPNMTLQDDHGGTVDEMSDGDGVSQWLGYVRKVKPADSISGNVLFDAEPKHYHLRLTDENGENPVVVDLPLNFNAEAPPMPLPSGGGGGDLRSPVKK